jgi:hypothetical protein
MSYQPHEDMNLSSRIYRRFNTYTAPTGDIAGYDGSSGKPTLDLRTQMSEYSSHAGPG